MYKDVIIIGGGSSGLYMAKLLEENHISYLIIENFHGVGGQCKHIYPYKYMYDVAGLPPITGEDFTNLLLSYINKNNIHLNEEFKKFNYQDNLIEIITNKNTYMCKKLIISNGMGACVFNKPIIENLELYENKQIFYFPENPSLIKNKNIIVFGGGDSALDAVGSLYENNKVSLVHRRNNFTAQSGKMTLLNIINNYIPYSLVSLNGTNELLESVTIKNNNAVINLNCDLVFFCYGYNQSHIEKIPVNPFTMESENKNIFAIGGIATYKNKRNLITTHMYEARILLNHILKIY